MWPCYSWTKSCDAPPDTCGSAQTVQSCPPTATWFWLAAAVAAAAVIAHNKRKGR